MIMYFFMLPKIFTSITRNTRALETQLILMGSNRSDNNNEIAAIHVKIRLFKTLRTAVVIYLGKKILAGNFFLLSVTRNYVTSKFVTKNYDLVLRMA